MPHDIIDNRTRELTPYWATLKRKAPHWEAPRLHRVTVFYVGMAEGKPVFSFQSGQLSQVVGLKIDQLEAELLQARCARGPAKDTPIRLLLSERNDQATFDRIYEILRDLMERHRV